MGFNIDEIKAQVKKVISSSQDIDNPKVDELIEKWLEKKRDFIEAFGGNLIWESKDLISMKLDEREKEKKVSEFSEKIYHTYKNSDLSIFIEQNAHSFFDNKVNETYNINGKFIPKGMKLVKAFKYFEDNTNTLKDIQNAASQIIQEDKVEGTLCFSVHPLDYLSSSENNYNWRSCHALDGDYRAGNLSYMTDKATVVCYIKGEQDEYIPNFSNIKWNSKKWRVLMFVSENWDMISPGRQYPFTSSSGIQKITDLFLKAIHKDPISFEPLTDFEVTSDMTDTYLRDSYIVFDHRLVAKTEIVINNSDLHYNDLLHSSCYNMLYATKRGFYRKGYKPIISIGNQVKCLYCGENYIEDSETMMCPECELAYGETENDIYAICDCCGRRFYREEGYYVENDLVCPNCAETYCFTCGDCGELFYNEDSIYDEDYEDFVCSECYECRQEEKKEREGDCE